MEAWLLNANLKSAQEEVKVGLARRFVFSILSLELFVASALKSVNSVNSSMAGFGLDFWGGNWQAAIEFVIAVWLVSGVCWRQVQLVAGVLFLLFSVANLLKIITGAESCGCFGAVEISPWYTLIANIGAILALSLVASPVLSLPRRHDVIKLLSILVGGFILYAVMTNMIRVVSNSANSPVMDAEGKMIFDKDHWIGHQMNLKNVVEIDANLATGIWVVVFIRSNCAKCVYNLPRQKNLAEEMARQGKTPRVAFIDLQRHHPLDDAGDAVCPSCAYGGLKEGRNLPIETPTIILINNGVVTRVLDDLPNRESAFWNSTSG